MIKSKLDNFNFLGLIKKRIEFRQNSLVVIKGCGFGSIELNGCETLFTIDRQSINDNTCDINNVVKLSVPKLITGKPFVLLYEDFILAADSLVTLLNVYEYKIYIIDNNLFQEYYPVPSWVDTKKLKKDIDNYQNSKLMEIYDDYICVNDEMLVSYQTFKEFTEAEWLPLYIIEQNCTCKKTHGSSTNIISLGSTSKAYSIGLINILNSKDNEFFIKEEENPFTQAHNALVQILSDYGLHIYKVQTKILNEGKKNYEEYEAILKRKDSKYTFKDIKFYTNPGYSLDTVPISQGEIIDGIVNNSLLALNTDGDYNDIFVTAPTGSGKSILFQIPAIFLAEKKELLTIIISPLIGLMNDQVKNIKVLTNQAATINSDYTPEEKEKIKEKIKNKEVSILYVSPETLLSNNPISALIGEERKIGLLVVDESHIVSTWGKSFRPDYWFLGDYISKMRTKDGMRFPIATFSATVTYGGDDDMHADIIDSLHMKTGKYEYIAPMRRDDISFDIKLLEKKIDYQKEKDDTALRTLNSLLKKKKKTIAYFPYTKTVNVFSKELPVDKVGRYHGSLNAIEKNIAVEDFRDGKNTLMLATKAFGMGIDIDDVEVVYHYAPTGNLCDYVQEIGRAARKPDMNGVAMVDFYKDNDYKFVNQLFGMSSIKNYQIVETLRKISKIYFEKQKRNFTVSPDDFAFIFSSVTPEEVDVLFKTALLMIQKDFEKMSHLIFKPLVFKPRSLFTKAYVMIKDEDKREFNKNIYKKYFKLYATGEEMATKFLEKRSYISRNYISGKTTVDTSTIQTSVRYQGDVYTVDLKTMWEDNFDKISFNQFKYEFYNGALNGFEIGKKLLPEYILTIKSKVGNFSQMYICFKQIMNEFDSIFCKSNYIDKQFTVQDLAKEIEKRRDSINLNRYESIVAAQTFIQVVNNYKSTKQLVSSYVFRFNTATGNYNISSLSQLRSIISDMIKKCESQYKSVAQADAKIFLVGNKNNEASKDSKSLIAQLLEAFNLGSYDVLSGERPEYFIRINSITSIEKIINNNNYQSQMVKQVKKRHEDSKKRMTNFFVNLKTDEERWDYIERYFAGMQDEYEDSTVLDEII